MWTKTLTELTGIPRVNMTKALKVLESRKLIVSIKSVKVSYVSFLIFPYTACINTEPF